MRLDTLGKQEQLDLQAPPAPPPTLVQPARQDLGRQALQAKPVLLDLGKQVLLVKQAQQERLASVRQVQPALRAQPVKPVLQDSAQQVQPVKQGEQVLWVPLELPGSVQPAKQVLLDVWVLQG